MTPTNTIAVMVAGAALALGTTRSVEADPAHTTIDHRLAEPQPRTALDERLGKPQGRTAFE